MDNLTKTIFDKRRSIIENIDALIKYSKKYHKNISSNQLSLFSSDTIELDRPELKSIRLDDYELSEMVDLEEESIGMSLSYSKYSKHLLNERLIAITNFEDVVYCVKNNSTMDFIAEVQSIEHKVSQYGNKYAKINFKRNGLTLSAYINGKIFKDNIHRIYTNSIYIVRIVFKNGIYSISRIANASEIDVSNRIKGVKIEIPNKNNLFRIRNYIFAKMRSDNGIEYKFNVLDTNYEMKEKISISGENISKIEKMGGIVNLMT